MSQRQHTLNHWKIISVCSKHTVLREGRRRARVSELVPDTDKWLSTHQETVSGAKLLLGEEHVVVHQRQGIENVVTGLDAEMSTVLRAGQQQCRDR